MKEHNISRIARTTFNAVGLAVLVAIVLLSTASHSWASTIVVSPSNMDGWAFNTTDNGGGPGGTGTGQMVSGPASPPLGTGSANFLLSSGANGDESVQIRNSNWDGTLLSALTELSYSTYASSYGGDQLPYLTLYVNTTGGADYDDRLHFEPVYSASGAGNGNPYAFQGPVALNTWQTWDALLGMWYSDGATPNANAFPAEPNGPGDHAITFQQYVALFPDAVIRNPGLGGVRLTSGFSSASDLYNTNVDAFTVGTTEGTTVYDFELEDPVPVPEPGTLTLLGFGLVGLARKRFTSRRSA